MNDQNTEAYEAAGEHRAAKESVVSAREEYTDACVTHGIQSRVAQQASDRLKGEVDRRVVTERRQTQVELARAVVEHEQPLRALRPIETVGDVEPFRLVTILDRHGSVQSANDVMAAKVRWASRAGYSILTRDVPQSYAPYNAVIRIRLNGTEDRNRDYLAHIVD